MIRLTRQCLGDFLAFVLLTLVVAGLLWVTP